MRFFDTHAHIGLIFDDPIEQHVVCQRAAQADVKHIVSISNSIIDFFTIYENLKIESNVCFAAGISPSEVNNLPKDWQLKVENALKLPNIVALGEIGLDYFHKFGDKIVRLNYLSASLTLQFITTFQSSFIIAMPAMMFSMCFEIDYLPVVVCYTAILKMLNMLKRLLTSTCISRLLVISRTETHEISMKPFKFCRLIEYL